MADDGGIDEDHSTSSTTFSSLGIDDWLVDALAAMSIKRPTPIQAACIRPILEGTYPVFWQKLTDRTRLHRRSQDRVRQDNSLCSADTAKMVSGSIRYIRSCS